MRTLKPAVRYRKTADGLEEPITGSDVEYPMEIVRNAHSPDRYSVSTTGSIELFIEQCGQAVFDPKPLSPSYEITPLSDLSSSTNSLTPVRSLPNEVVQSGRGDGLLALVTRNSVEASYWEELGRLFPGVPSSGRRASCPISTGGPQIVGDIFASREGERFRPSRTSTPLVSEFETSTQFEVGEDDEFPGLDSGLSDRFFDSACPSRIRNTLLRGLEKYDRPSALRTERWLLRSEQEAIARSFDKNGRVVPFDEIDAKLMQQRRSLLGLEEDDFFTRSVVVQEMIRPSQRLGIGIAEEWSTFRVIPRTVGVDVTGDGSGYPDPSGSSRGITDVLLVPRGVGGKKCNFCFNNKEPVEVWSTHDLKGEDGRIACHILRNYVCPRCFASGDKAHTNRYCPLNKTGESGASIKDLNTGRTSAGRFSMNAKQRCKDY